MVEMLQLNLLWGSPVEDSLSSRTKKSVLETNYVQLHAGKSFGHKGRNGCVCQKKKEKNVFLPTIFWVEHDIIFRYSVKKKKNEKKRILSIVAPAVTSHSCFG